MPKNFSQDKKILILGDYRHSLIVIRSLAKAGYQIIAGQSDPSSPFGRCSRFTSEVWNHPAIEGSGESFMAALEEFFRRRKDVPLIFPTGDDESAALARNISRIPAGVKVVMPDPMIIKTCHKKMEMCKVAEKLNIPQARLKKVHNLQELKEAAGEIGYPCIIRPYDQFTRIFNEKVFICPTPNTIDEAFKNWPVEGDSLIVQKYVTGPRHDLYFIAEEGTIITGVEEEALRTDRLNGSGIFVDSVSVELSPSVLDASRKIVKYFKYTGLGCAQFIVDEHGELKCFLEVNPRVGASLALPQRSKVDFPRMAVELTEGRSLLDTANTFNYTRGVRYGWLYGDIQGLRSAISHGQINTSGALRWLGRLISTFYHADTHTNWSTSDPKPAIALYKGMFFNFFQKIASRLGKNHST